MIHFVFQHLRGVGRDELFYRCYNSWKKTFVESDSVCIVTSGAPVGWDFWAGIEYQAGSGPGRFPMVLNCSERLLACQKRNIGISSIRWLVILREKTNYPI